MFPTSLLLLTIDDAPSRMDELGHHFKTLGEPTASGASWWLILAGILALAALVITGWYTLRWYRTRVYCNPRRLLTQLCRAHGLDRPQQALLESLAQASGAADPTLLFVDPTRFETKRLPANLKPQAQAVEDLRNLLFSE